jgi:hypoxanthine phosphoribosyltransferase
MVYGYKTNKEFINNSYKLLEKMEDKGLWDKDTLIIGLDKSVRPLFYTLRKLSKKFGKKSPDIKFVNYEIYPNSDIYGEKNYNKNVAELSEEVSKRIKAEGSKKYDKVLILDDYIQSGKTINEVEEILKNALDSNLRENNYVASLGVDPEFTKKESFDNSKYFFTEKAERNVKSNSRDSGIRDSYKNKSNELLNPFLPSVKRVPSKIIYKNFINERTQLSKDIKQYVHEIHPELQSNQSSLEKRLVSGFFTLSILTGLAFSLNSITGNVIGTNSANFSFSWAGLFLIGILGLYINKRFYK